MRELKEGSSSEAAQVSSEGAQARKLKQGSKQARRQAGKQALGRHSVGAMPWRGLFLEGKLKATQNRVPMKGLFLIYPIQLQQTSNITNRI